MRKHLGIIAAVWLSFSTSYFMGFIILNWEWWVVCIPTIVLFALNERD